jgi:hypothetical protein
MMRLVSKSDVPSNAAPPIHQFCAIILAPSIMKSKPRPRIMPSTTGREMSSAQIGERQGALRAVHLKYHLATTELLSADQRRRYGELRGYR